MGRRISSRRKWQESGFHVFYCDYDEDVHVAGPFSTRNRAENYARKHSPDCLGNYGVQEILSGGNKGKTYDFSPEVVHVLAER